MRRPGILLALLLASAGCGDDAAPPNEADSAATLRAVRVDRNADDLHGVTSHLDDADLDDRVTILLALDDHVE